MGFLKSLESCHTLLWRLFVLAHGVLKKLIMDVSVCRINAGRRRSFLRGKINMGF